MVMSKSGEKDQSEVGAVFGNVLKGREGKLEVHSRGILGPVWARR